MKTHIETALEEIKNIATFNSKANIFDDCLSNFFIEFKIATTTDVENLHILAQNENLNKLYIDDSTGKFTFDNPTSNLPKLFVRENNIDCQTLMQAATEIKNRNIENTVPPDFENVLLKFRELFCDEQRNYNPQVIRYITSIKSLNISGTISEICYHFIKSFLSAEFLILDDFSNKIEETRKYINSYYGGFANKQEKNSKNLSFYIIKSFVQVLYYAVEMCKKHEHYLHNSEEKLICLNNDRQLRFYRTPAFSQVDFTIGEKEVLPYERLMESVIDTTIIDLDYTVTEENFDKLFRLWRRIKIVEKFYELQYNPKWGHVFFMLKTKTAILLKRMLDSKINNSDYKIVNVEEDEKKEIEKYHNQFIENDLFKQNPFIKIIEDKKNKIINKIEFQELLNSAIVDEIMQKDIFIYDEYAKDGIEIYCNNSQYFKDNALDDVNIDKLNKLLKQDDHRHFNSQTLFVKLIKNLVSDIDNKLEYGFEVEYSDKIEKRLNLLSNLLVEMEHFVERAKTNKIKQVMPVFAYSFYTVKQEDNDFEISFAGNLKEKIKNYNFDNFDNYCFIASVGLAPVNIVYVETEIMNFKIQISELNFKYDHALSKAVVDKEGKKMLDNNEKIIKSNQQEAQKETITILGVFAALLAFVTASIGLIKIAQNLFEYAVFGVIFTSALLMFVVIINSVICKKREEKEKKWDYFVRHFGLPLLMIAIMIVALVGLSFCPNLKKDINSEPPKTEISIKADVQNHTESKVDINSVQQQNTTAAEKNK
ncbi:MAG: hypothetical protein LBN95_10745 [Prevotellaceae bacterium]|jgi:hypothetical protein|nr:hypothetical protein [Prevotellaceae bacterium]